MREIRHTLPLLFSLCIVVCNAQTSAKFPPTKTTIITDAHKVTVEKTPWRFRSTDNLATIIGYLLVAGASVFTYCQWRKDQDWKKKELLINRIKAFNETPGAHNALLMLDWADREIPLWARDKVEDRYERVQRKQVSLALIPKQYLTFVFSPKESAIRDCFEDFLTKLSHLEIFLGVNLLSKSEVQVIMESLLITLSNLKTGNEEDQALLRNFYIYIGWKRYSRITKLFRRFDVLIEEEIRQATPILQAEIASGVWIRQ